MTASPGVYRLCWCSEGQNCILPTHFMAYAGILQVGVGFKKSILRIEDCWLLAATGC